MKDNKFSYLGCVLLAVLILFLLQPIIAAAEEAEIANLEELLSTVPSSELGFQLLSIDKMAAARMSSSESQPEMTPQKLAIWIGSIQDSTAQEYIRTLLGKWREGELGALSISHKVELFNITSIYSNAGSTAYRSRVTITVTSGQDATGVRVLELVPKAAAASASDIIFPLGGEQARVLEQDPLVEWSIPLMLKGETKTITYYLKSTAQNDDFSTISLYTMPGAEALDDEWVVEELPSEPVQEPEPTAPADAEEDKPTAAADDAPKQPSIFIPIIISVIIIEIGLAILMLTRRKQASKSLLPQKSQEAQPEASIEQEPPHEDLVLGPDIVIPYDKVRSVEKYIESELRKGKKDKELIEELVGIGWNEEIVDIIMHDVHTIDTKIEKMDKYVQDCVSKGKPLAEIKAVLLKLGWREDLVDLALDDFK